MKNEIIIMIWNNDNVIVWKKNNENDNEIWCNNNNNESNEI